MTGGAVGGFLDIATTGTADSNGNATLSFPSVPSQRNWSGLVSVPNAASNTSWTVQVNGSPVATITGSNAYGAFGLNGGDRLTLVGVGVAGAAYTGVMHGQFFPGTVAKHAIIPSAQLNSVGSLSGVDTIGFKALTLPLGLNSVGNFTANKQNYRTIEVTINPVFGSSLINPLVVAVQVVNVGVVGAPNPAAKDVASQWQTQAIGLNPLTGDAPQTSFFFPVSCNIGDSLRVMAFTIANPFPANQAAVAVYGHSEAVQAFPLRSDGRLMPIGRLSASGTVVGAVSGTIIPAPAQFVSILLKSLNFSIVSGQPVDVGGTRNGAGIVILSSGGVTGWAKEWPGGLLLDPQTALTQNLAAAGTIRTNVDYDLVV